ncbi:toll/interleukin-1 receptor domain-containing protein [Paenibacillus sp. FSL H8-0283]|uniref:toll/interleukin-1 receptor domain-containing protein n=1 Tax=Paenibacillus sp. FSL H8-0283 TaxID=2921383 RepID=UPI003255D8C3
MNVFLSYSWKNQNVADVLDNLFRKKSIIIKRDVRDVEYRQSIKEFMRQIRKSDYVLLVISEAYLKSVNCMFELTEFLKDDNFRERWIPVVHEETGIFTEIGRIEYIEYWQEEYKKLKDKVEYLDELNKLSAISELRKLESIQRMMSEFLTIISETKMITFTDNISKDDFEQIYCAIFPESTQKELILDGYYLLNVPRTLHQNIMNWWAEDNHTYTVDTRNARLFTTDEVRKHIKNDYDAKKNSAIPADIIIKANQTILPFTEAFVSVIERNRERIIGNKYMYLSVEELKIFD